MNAQPYEVNNPNSDLSRLLDEADRKPVDVEKNGVRYRVMRLPDDVREDSEARKPYDPERMVRAIYASAGALKDVDTDALLQTIREERTQNSTGRPAE